MPSYLGWRVDKKQKSMSGLSKNFPKPLPSCSKGNITTSIINHASVSMEVSNDRWFLLVHH